MTNNKISNTDCDTQVISVNEKSKTLSPVSEQVNTNEKDILPFEIDSYIQERWNKQYANFSKTSEEKKKWFYRCQSWILFLCAASVAVLTIDLDSLGYSWLPSNKVVCALISLVVMIITGIDKLKQYNSEWMKNRKVAEQLKSEICKYKFGVGPYTDETYSHNNIFPDSPEYGTTTKDAGFVPDRTKLFIDKLNIFAQKYDDDAVRSIYKDIKSEIANYVAGASDYSEMRDHLSAKDKAFVTRINVIIDDYVKSQDIFSRIKNELCDFYTDGGVYEKEEKTRFKISPNDRLFVNRVEDIIAGDIEEFVSAKRISSDIKMQADNWIESKPKR